MTLEDLLDLRETTDHLSGFLKTRLEGYLKTLSPILKPERVLGKHAGGKVIIPGADKAYGIIKQRYHAVHGSPFKLRTTLLEDHGLPSIAGGLVLYPWEYSYTAKRKKKSADIEITSPARWVLTYKSEYSLNAMRKAVRGELERNQDAIQEFVISALVVDLIVQSNPGVVRILSGLGHTVKPGNLPEFKDLPLVVLGTKLPVFRPPDDLMLSATRLSGVMSFNELINTDEIDALEDPFKRKLKELIAEVEGDEDEEGDEDSDGDEDADGDDDE